MNNIEIKAKVTEAHQRGIREYLHLNKARHAGTDTQTDTYFNVPEGKGRLKLREGNIENALIAYMRPDTAGPKNSQYVLTRLDPLSTAPLKESLKHCYGVKVVVDKLRDIFYLDNVKVHLDFIRGLGYFVEIEARNEDWGITEVRLREQCDELIAAFRLDETQMITNSYSDMILAVQALQADAYEEYNNG